MEYRKIEKRDCDGEDYEMQKDKEKGDYDDGDYEIQTDREGRL